MSVHKATIEWQRETDSFQYAEYSRNHIWRLDKTSIKASAAPGYLGDELRVDPEQAFVASLSSCHMLTFLALASKKGYVLNSYVDEATGLLSKNADGKLAMTRVTLRPRTVFSGDRLPDQAALKRMHELAHRECFIASSVRTEIVVEHADT